MPIVGVGGGSGGGASAGSGNASVAGSAGSEGSPPANMIPAGAKVLGPYPQNGGSGAVGMDWGYSLTLGADGFFFLNAVGSLQLNQAARVTAGLIRAPSAAGIGSDWICPGPAAGWLPISSDGSADCTDLSNRCNYQLIMPNPSQFSCTGASTSGNLSFPPMVSDGDTTAPAVSSIPALNGAGLAIRSTTTLSLDPMPAAQQNPYQVSYYDMQSNGQMLDLYFTATPVTPLAGQPVTQWTLSNIDLEYRPQSDIGPYQIICATGGSYEISSTMPIQHSVSLTGVSAPLSCPGTPLGTPLVIGIGH
jgi:hypothetical protein